MCGFVGLINKDKSTVDFSELYLSASKIKHRGPDEENYFLQDSIGLYHLRLSIIDLEQGKQPMTENELTIVFNGEIYNFIELREDLIKKGFRFRTESDTEVLLKAYQCYGKGCLSKINGMFAFAIYDRKENKIFAARDHFGIKPFYYTSTKNKFIFASEIKSILSNPEVISSPDFKSINEYVTFQYILDEKTLFKNIFKILPGHFLEYNIDSNSINIQKYWNVKFQTDNNHTEKYFVEKLDYLLSDSIKIQCRSDVPIGAHLSGGMDSSTVSILASQHVENFQTFTGAFKEGKEFDESHYAKSVSNSIGAQNHLVYPNVKEFVELLPKLIYHMDEPVAGPGLFPQYMVSKLAAENVKVVLGGQGGDEVFGGYAKYLVAYLEQALKGSINGTNEEGEHIVSLNSIIPNLSSLKNYNSMMKNFFGDGFFGEMDERYYRLIDRKNGSSNLYSSEFIESCEKEVLLNKFKNIFNHPDTKSYFNKMTNYDLSMNIPALLHVEDRMSMAVSLESRVPLLDKRIAELMAGIPPVMKFKGAELKYLFKKVTKKIVPTEIYKRKDKMGFPVPLHQWAKDGAGDFIREILLSSKAKERGIYNSIEIEKLILNERSYGRKLWGLLSLELWFQTFIDTRMNEEDNEMRNKIEQFSTNTANLVS